MTIRSVKEPRTADTARAKPIEITVCKIVSGIKSVNEGPKRVKIICETGSPVLQLAP